MADVSVHILDLRQVLLGHLDQLCGHSLLCELGGAVVLGGGVLIVLPILLKKETQRALQNPYRRGRHSPPLFSQLDLKTLESPSPNHRHLFPPQQRLWKESTAERRAVWL